MADRIMHGTPAGDFHTWVDPSAGPCPNCECCTERLCERGRKHAFGCLGVATSGRELVRDCPCSAETTEGTEAHRAAMSRAANAAAKRGQGHTRVRDRARTQLVHRYPDEYAELIAAQGKHPRRWDRARAELARRHEQEFRRLMTDEFAKQALEES
ncbi:hypothetical protein GCM10023196_036010 [Actinoallomurus vinaceus]|uniref:Uncharacterized protein n=1 Tax=Actinoallomurus vinaceus TaxID=1080074 RepID=A0ABP8U970_9ACTN